MSRFSPRWLALGAVLLVALAAWELTGFVLESRYGFVEFPTASTIIVTYFIHTLGWSMRTLQAATVVFFCALGVALAWHWPWVDRRIPMKGGHPKNYSVKGRRARKIIRTNERSAEMQFLKNNIAPVTAIAVAVAAVVFFPFTVPVKSAGLAQDLIAFFGMPLSGFFAWLGSQLAIGGTLGALIVLYLIAPLPLPDGIKQAITGIVFTVIADVFTSLTGAVPASYLPLPLWQIALVLIAVAVQYLAAQLTVGLQPESTYPRAVTKAEASKPSPRVAALRALGR